jgi:hypothetical protein
MSKIDEITKYRIKRSFEDNDQEWVDSESFQELLTHARSLEAMMRKHEWQLAGYSVCLECDELESSGHSPDCELARLLE